MRNFVKICHTLLAIIWCGFCFAGRDPSPTEPRCEAAIKAVEAGAVGDLAILGDCYYYGVKVKKDHQNAQFYYLQGMINNQDYGGLRLGIDLLFSSREKVDKAMGFYLLKTITEGNDSNYRGYASYYLAAFLAQNNSVEKSAEYLKIAVREGSLDGLFAAAYQEILEGNRGGELDELLNSAIEFQRDQGVVNGDLLSFSCWVESQNERVVEYPITSVGAGRIKEKFGECKIKK
ncbi:hypothetical protein [Zhongshania borealis]|uniref:Sel1 repeat family protein n=1 Tax=Zhongshania borealis TaxID=889488 RepID=A0ABP7X8A3_9GAMM